MTTPEEVKQKLKKVLGLVQRGIGGEKETAQKLLVKILEENNLTLQDLTGEERKQRTFKGINSQQEEDLYAYIIKHVAVTDSIYVNKKFKYIYCDLTESEYIEAKILIDWHLKNFKHEQKQMKKRHAEEKKALENKIKKEKALLARAYSVQNELFTKHENDENEVDEPDLTEEALELFHLATKIGTYPQPRKMIEG